MTQRSFIRFCVRWFLPANLMALCIAAVNGFSIDPMSAVFVGWLGGAVSSAAFFLTSE